MRVLIASDSFKDALTSLDVCSAISKGLLTEDSKIKVEICPMGDGGDGTADVLRYHLDLDTISVTAFDPLFRRIETSYLWHEESQTAYIEMAAISGIQLLELHERNPMHTSSFGTGELIIHALDRGAKTIYLTIGGSATNDGGIGMATALGYCFQDADGISQTPVGYFLDKIETIIPPQNPKYSDCRFVTFCDVDNPLTGKNGASYTYGAQKGATETEIEILDNGLGHLAQKINAHLGIDILEIKGSGAAGGLGGGSVAFLNAELRSGIFEIMEIIDFDSKVKSADLVICGEGQFDKQSLQGKVFTGIASQALQYDKPLIVMTGNQKIELQECLKYNVVEICDINESLNPTMTKKETLNATASQLEHCAASLRERLVEIIVRFKTLA